MTPAREPPLVTIVITAYNDATTIEQAIESALHQDWPHTEIIVVLDGPQDHTPQVAARYREAVQIIHQPNGGTASARNTGMARARGQWIQFLDADDVLLSTKISASLAAWQRSAHQDHIALIYTGYYRIDEQGQIFAQQQAEDYSREKLLLVPGHVTPNPMIRVSSLQEIGEYSSEYIYAEDTELYHRLALRYLMLALPQPQFLYRTSLCQKTRVMRNHERGNLIREEPRRIRQTYEQRFADEIPRWMHPLGTLSRRGVLDVGLKCPHSCKFCYYSFMDGSDDQFRAMRRASFRDTDHCKEIVRGFARAGLTHFDITGGEPTLHPEIVEIVRYARQELGLLARMITLGQFLTRPRGQDQRRLLDQLAEAGLEDLLLSVHAVDPQLFNAITGGQLALLSAAMDELDQRGESYCTNTLIFADNYRHLPEIAQHLAGRRVRIANFIVMNTYFQWNEGGRVMGVQARYRDIRPYLEHATLLLEEAGIAVNIRYGPYCAYRNLEKNYVGVLGVELDPYEWRTTLREGRLKAHRSVAEYLQKQRQLLDDPRSMFTKSFGPGCAICRLRFICDGVDTKYIAEYGWSEFEPYPLPSDAERIRNPLHFRMHNPRTLLLKGASTKDEEPASRDQVRQRPSDKTIAGGSRGRHADSWRDHLAAVQQHMAQHEGAAARKAQQQLESCAAAPGAAVLLGRSVIKDGMLVHLPSATPLLKQCVFDA